MRMRGGGQVWSREGESASLGEGQAEGVPLSIF